jgi:GMP synthase-like glutamine amidotransferase
VRILVQQAEAKAGPAYLIGWAREREIELEVVDVRTALRLPSPRGYDAAVALGAEESWAAVPRPPWMTRQLDWLDHARATAVPVLGICFGAQALATLHGGEVRPLPRPEIGWLQLELADSVDLPSGPWLSWHEDFIALPPVARELARSPVAPHIFEVSCGLGVQFHPEADTETIRSWIDDATSRDLSAFVRSPAELLADSVEHAETARVHAYGLFDHFLRTLVRRTASGRDRYDTV